jgi:hypothetical protein
MLGDKDLRAIALLHATQRFTVEEALQATDNYATAGSQLFYLIPRLFPELGDDPLEAEVDQAIYGYLAFHHGMSVAKVDCLAKQQIAAILADDLRKWDQAQADPQERTADTKTDSGKKLPDNPEVLRCAKFVRDKLMRMAAGDTPKAERKAIVQEFIEDHHPDPKPKLNSFDKNFQPSRYGWLLDIADS